MALPTEVKAFCHTKIFIEILNWTPVDGFYLLLLTTVEALTVIFRQFTQVFLFFLFSYYKHDQR